MFLFFSYFIGESLSWKRNKIEEARVAAESIAALLDKPQIGDGIGDGIEDGIGDGVGDGIGDEIGDNNAVEQQQLNEHENLEVSILTDHDDSELDD